MGTKIFTGQCMWQYRKCICCLLTGSVLLVAAFCSTYYYLLKRENKPTPPLTSQSETWNEIAVFESDASSDSAGYSVSMSNDGTFISFGAPESDANGKNSGKVVVYISPVDTSKSPIAESQPWNITGDNSEALFGSTVSLSGDGTRLAVGSRDDESQTGQVLVYEFYSVTNKWLLLGDAIIGLSPGDFLGAALSLSNDGNRIAVSSPVSNKNGIKSGHVRVFEYDGAAWNKVGDDIVGKSGDMAGSAVSLSADGSILAVGFMGREEKTGSVVVYQYKSISDSWVPLGEAISGEQEGDKFGGSVSLSGDGKRIAIGGKGYSGNGIPLSGVCRTYQFKNSKWYKIGSSLVGEAPEDHFGHKVMLSGDGNRLVVSSKDGNNWKGYVRIYDASSGDWSQIGETLQGKAFSEHFGSDVSISYDGRRVSVGATSVGKVYVYDDRTFES